MVSSAWLLWRSSSAALASTWSPLGGRGLRTRAHRHRGSPHSGQVLLDKFVKRVSVDGGLTISAPFAVKVRGTYFDGTSVDGKRNRLAREEKLASAVKTISASRNEVVSDDEATERSPWSSDGESLEEFGSAGDAPSSGDEVADMDHLEGQSLRRLQLNELRSILERRASAKREDEERGSVELGGVRLPATDVYPLHVLVYGRSYHRCDSYSVVGGGEANTHVHVGDAIAALDEPDDSAFFLHQHYPVNGSLHGLRPCGGAAVWLPHRLRSVFPDEDASVNRDGDKMLSEIKFYTPPHLLELQEHGERGCVQHEDDHLSLVGIRGVFLAPTSLGRIFVRTERDAPVEVDGGLHTHLSTVSVVTEGGSIRVRDVQVSRELRLSSGSGDILCEGVVDGHLLAETREDGDFIAR